MEIVLCIVVNVIHSKSTNIKTLINGEMNIKMNKCCISIVQR